MNAAIALQVMVELLSQLNAIATTLRTADAEKRDVSDAEIDAVLAQDDAAKAKLQAHIDAIRNGG